ncbi:winged helix-turn-helix transcriptional regulator [Flexivirga sp. ID2601S]|uniref:Winged helix-turn-helix transcriptional regulator n=1 Tax=Flexivirga aerilata TaxID=1656889 RepID=A0A849AEW7_9MICO|nr:winged helix-turn-helix domain-containing protein [Flexivirga aerilata]NNG38447.1 winged helix-turn-helix transcriptional regulator [Flexivirga aerilata]
MSDEPAAVNRTPNPPSIEALKKLSVSVRWRAYESLRTLGPCTSRELAKRVGVKEASMSVHLREMKAIGYVTAEGDPAKPRSLQWAAVLGGVDLDEFDRTESYAQAASGWMKVLLAAEAELAVDWVDVAPRWPKEWRSAAENSDAIVRLTVDELREIAEEMRALMRKVEEMAEGRAVDDPRYRPVVAITHAFPYPDEY